MNKKSFIFVWFLALFAVCFTACSKDDDKDEAVPVYSYGITQAEYPLVTTSSSSATGAVNEGAVITEAFAEAFKSALGVSGNSFAYNGGDDKVLAACEQAKTTLDAKTFKCKYTLEVTKVDQSSKVIFTWNSPTASAPEPEAEPADYAILFYGHGGRDLDKSILNNIRQFYKAYKTSYDKVKIAVEYKFSTEDNLEGDFEDQKEWRHLVGSKTMRYVLDPTSNFETLLQNPSSVFLDDNNLEVSKPKALTDYIKWAVEQVPAKKYVLILADHGGGYRPDEDMPEQTLSKGVIFDDGNDVVNFSVFSLAQAIRESGIKPEVIYFDACLMNTVEYLFELKDLTNYLVVSTFPVPGPGGNYTALINELANNDIEESLTNVSVEAMKIWDAATDYKYSDITVYRTSGFDAFGAKLKDFTDRLIKAYTEGGADVKANMDTVTGYEAFKIDNVRPGYALMNYIAIFSSYVPEYFPESFCNPIAEAYENCLVASQVSHELKEAKWSIPCSVMLGCKNHYRMYQWLKPSEAAEQYPEYAGVTTKDPDGFVWTIKTGWVLFGYKDFYADGSAYTRMIDGTEKTSTWGSTFDETYKKLKFDQITGWSRWLELNEQEPTEISPTGMAWSISSDITSK